MKKLITAGACAGALALAACSASASPLGASTRHTKAAATATATATHQPAATASSAAAATPPAQAAAGPLPVLVIHPDVVPSSRDYAVIQPTRFGVSADVNSQVRGLRWSYWTASSALGHGKRVVDSCQPNCATGTITMIPETVALSRPRGGRFTVMTETYNGQTYTYSGRGLDILSASGQKAPLPKRRSPAPAPAASTPSASSPSPSPRYNYNDVAILSQAVAEYVQRTSGQTVLHSVCVAWPTRAHHYTCTETLKSGPDVAGVVVSNDGSRWTIVSSG